MTYFKKFAIVGCGFLGSKILAELAQKKATGVIESLLVVSRSDKARDEIVSKGAELRTITDYTDIESLTPALRGSEVVICAVPVQVAALQDPIARAAKAADVKLFVLSDFGTSTDGFENNLGHRFGVKQSMKKLLREKIDLPYVSFYTGAFTDFFFVKAALAFGFDFVGGKFVLQGKGEAENSYTSTNDIAHFVAHALTSLPSQELEWRIFRIEGERTTWNKIIAEWEDRTGRKAQVTHHPIEEAQNKLKANPLDVLSDLSVIWDNGEGIVGTKEQVENAAWPEWKPKSVIDVILENYKTQA